MGTHNDNAFTSSDGTATVTATATTAIAVVTAAGRSTRIGHVGTVIPKALLPLSPRPTGGVLDCALSRLLDDLCSCSVEAVVVGNGHPWFAEVARAFGARCVTAEPTGEWDAVLAGIGATTAAAPNWTSLIIASGDNFFPGAGLRQFVANPPGGVRLAVAWSDQLAQFTKVTVASPKPGTRVVTGLVEKPPGDGAGLAKAGLYQFPRDAIATLAATDVPVDRFGERSMTNAVQQLLTAQVVHAVPLPHGFVDIGSTDGLRRATSRSADIGASPEAASPIGTQ